MLVAISTSGHSSNVIRAVEAANTCGALTIIGLTDRGGGRLAQISGGSLIVPAEATNRIQEAHITIIHLLCEIVEPSLLGELAPPQQAC